MNTPVATSMYTQWLFEEKLLAEGKSCYSYTPIADALSALAEDEKVKFRNKFDIAIFIAKEKVTLPQIPQYL